LYKVKTLFEAESDININSPIDNLSKDLIKETSLFGAEPDKDINSLLTEKPREELFEIKQDEKIRPLHKVEKQKK